MSAPPFHPQVVVGDDCALAGRGTGIAGRRGIAGTCFVHKIAGALAEKGASLAEVKEAAQAAADAMGSMGVALRSCTLPGAGREGKDERIEWGKMEVGLGIHGEPGALTADLVTADEVVVQLVEFIYKSGYLTLSKGDQAILIIRAHATPNRWQLSRTIASSLYAAYLHASCIPLSCRIPPYQLHA